MLRSLLLVTLVASAAWAGSLQDCRNAFKAAAPGNNMDARCKALAELGSCINANLASMTHNERLNSQGFFDAIKLTSSCAGVEVPTVNVALYVAETLVGSAGNTGNTFRERRAVDSVSIWDINDRYNEFAQTVVDKATFASVQKVVTDLQSGNSDSLNAIRTDIQDIVNERLSTMTAQIKAAMDTTVASLKTISSSIEKSTSTRLSKLDNDIKTAGNNVATDILASIAADNLVTKASISSLAALATAVDGRVTALDGRVDGVIASALGDTKANVDKLLAVFQKTPVMDPKLPVFRYSYWSTYAQAHGWYCDNNAAMFGGINPSTWSDGSAYAYQLSADKNVLRTLFNKKMNSGWNANVQSREWYYSGSTSGDFVGALFRIRNTKATAITWNTFFYFSSYSGWGEMASVAMNGVSQWTYAGTCQGSCTANVAMAIPANRVSTAIFISSSGGPSTTRSNVLIFYNNCLQLPDGLEYVDDFDYATGGWEA